jgi:hypothetical protein
VRFIGFGDSSLNLEVFAYVSETEYETFLHIQEDLLLRIMDIIEANGSGFAFPSQTTYLAQDAGLDAVKSQRALATVRQWRGNKANCHFLISRLKRSRKSTTALNIHRWTRPGERKLNHRDRRARREKRE